MTNNVYIHTTNKNYNEHNTSKLLKMGNNIHELKTWKEYFEEVFMGHKSFEVRKNDRNFQKGDILILKEWDNEKQEYTGRQMARSISYILTGGQFGVENGFVVMALA